MSKKKKFDELYVGVEERDNGIVLLYSNTGVPSCIFEIENPVTQLCTDAGKYQWYFGFLRNIADTLGEGYAIQKQDIFCRQSYHRAPDDNDTFLSGSYFRHFEGRKYTDIRTFLTISQEPDKGLFVTYDVRKETDFFEKIFKVKNLFKERRVSARMLTVKQVDEYIHRFMGFSFRSGAFSLQNVRADDQCLYFGDNRILKSFQLMDIEKLDMPNVIRPFTEDSVNGFSIATDLLSFLSNIPDAECVVYNQVIKIPNQRERQQKLIAKQKRHAAMPDPSNRIAFADIQHVLDYLAVNNDLLVDCNFNILVSSLEEKSRQIASHIETKLYNIGITPSKAAYNQLELFSNSFPGMAYSFNPDYDLCVLLATSALCFFYKERLKRSEVTPLKIYYTDRQGLPVCIDLTGKEGTHRLTDNANFFCIGPSGSGKSFHMNSVVRQLLEQDTEVVMVDTGHSYEGLNRFFNGTYIAYSKEQPISMNPFRITEIEYNENFGEKKNFLKSLIFLIFKGNQVPTKAEEAIVDQILDEYYKAYFSPFDSFSESERYGHRLTFEANERFRKLKEDALEVMGDGLTPDISEEERKRLEAEREAELAKAIEYKIDILERERKKLKVDSLSFNSFYDFAIPRLIQIIVEDKVEFPFHDFCKVLKQFYRGGNLEFLLNNDMGIDLFNEKFIVFEIDQIKDDPVLFPIVVLIIMDVFLQKMRLKATRKVIIIEEAWKAIASPTMADYIKYLYKTVRKFNGMVGIVTQELNDVIDSPIVREAIINNSDIKILLDQTKFKDRYEDISRILGLTQVQKQQIFTINALNNKDGRAFFKEVWISRGQVSDVFGVEEAPECYWAYTTERAEKEALNIYRKHYKDIKEAIIHIEADRQKTGLVKDYLEFSRLVNRNGKVMELWKK